MNKHTYKERKKIANRKYYEKNKDRLAEKWKHDDNRREYLKERLTPKATKVKNPVSDLVDAYFIAKCGAEGML